MRTGIQQLTAITGLLALLAAAPAAAQIDTAVTFDAPFAFYAGEAKMPAGSYRITQPDITAQVLLIENADASQSAFVDYVPVALSAPAPKGEIAFKKYGTADFLSGITMVGQELGMEIRTSKAEEHAAATAAAVKHSVPVKRGR
jgi:hypothetical protein